jgi:hypothetical protein
MPRRSSSKHGRGRDHRSTAKGIERAVRRAGLGNGFSAHSFRRTFASQQIIGLGLDPVRVPRLLGHTSPAFTSSTYAHMFEQGPQTSYAIGWLTATGASSRSRRPRGATAGPDRDGLPGSSGPVLDTLADASHAADSNPNGSSAAASVRDRARAAARAPADLDPDNLFRRNHNVAPNDRLAPVRGACNDRRW